MSRCFGALLALGLIISSTAAAEGVHPEGGEQSAGPLAPTKRAHEEIYPVNLPPGWSWPPSQEMIATGERCLEDLDQLGVHYRRVTKRVRRIVTPVVVDDMDFAGLKLTHTGRKRRAFVMDCHLARSLAMHAKVLALVGVDGILFSSIYSYRRARLGGRERRMLSRHALGLAIDIHGVVTTDGQVRKVKRDYNAEDGLLKRVERLLTATGGFRAVVTPGNDKAHKDHFHLSARMDISGSDRDDFVEPEQVLAAAREYHFKRQREKRAERRQRARGVRRARRMRMRAHRSIDHELDRSSK